jgi:hypothetical protein
MQDRGYLRREKLLKTASVMPETIASICYCFALRVAYEVTSDMFCDVAAGKTVHSRTKFAQTLSDSLAEGTRGTRQVDSTKSRIQNLRLAA